MKGKGILSVFDICLIIGIGVMNVLYSVFSGTVDVIGSVTGIAGVLCVVLVAAVCAAGIGGGTALLDWLNDPQRPTCRPYGHNVAILPGKLRQRPARMA